MKDLSLANVLRYVFPSLVAYFYLYIYDASLAIQVLDSLGILGIISAVFVGSLLYLVYRPIYQYLIQRLQDKFRRKSKNCRTYLKKRYKKYEISLREADLLYVLIKERYLKDRYSQMMRETASGIHLLYLSCIIATVFVIWMFMIGAVTQALLFLGIALISFLGAFILDRSYEDIELRLLYSLDDKEVDSVATRILEKSSPASNNKKTDTLQSGV